MRGIGLAVALLLAACGGEAAETPIEQTWPKPTYRQLPGENRFVMIIPSEFPVERLKEVAKDKCGPVEFCQIFAWTDTASAAQTFPMTEQEMETLAFSYGVNRYTGHEAALWDCERWPREIPEECN